MDEHRGSRTARVVAVGRAVGVGGRRDAHVAALLPAADRRVVAVSRALGRGRGRTTLAWSAHPALRMLAVDAAVEEAVAALPTATVVVLGAGFDTRSWRLDALRGRRVVEVDHPATQAVKRARLDQSADAGRTPEFAGADLAVDDLDAVLEAVGHDPTTPTVWLWEAVVPYLAADAVDATVEVLGRRSARGSLLVMTSVAPGLFDPPLGRLVGGAARAAMRALGEPVLLAESDADVSSRLARGGFAVTATTGPRRWAVDAGLRVVGPVLDERLHVAERRG